MNTTAKRVCVIGTGRWGKNHVRTLDQLGALAAVADPDASALERFRGEYPHIETHASADEALRADYDGYTVAAPAHLHYAIGKAILERGKPALIEKPLALRVDEARELMELSERSGAPLMVGHVMLFHPAVQAIKRLIQEGKIGRLQYLYSNRLNLGTVRTEENILWSFAPHDIAIFHYFIEKRPLRVSSRGGIFLQPNIHDSTMTVLEFPENIVGHIFVSWLHPFKEHRLVVIGSKGMLVFEDSGASKDLLFYEKGIDWVNGEPVKRDGPAETIPYEKKMPLTEELRYFVDHIGGPMPEISNGRNGVEVLEVLEVATRGLNGGAGGEVKKERSGGYYVHPTSVVDEPASIGEGTKIWHFSHIQSHVRIGRNCTFGQNVNVGNRVTIGSHVKVQNNVSIYEGVELEDYVFCGPSMVFTNITDPRCKYPQRGTEHYRKTLVREGASIGANATVVCGNTIGRHAFIGAGAVVTRDVPDYALMVGVPARRTGWVCECGEVLPPFSVNVKCPRCGLEYELRNGLLGPMAGEGEKAGAEAAAARV